MCLFTITCTTFHVIEVPKCYTSSTIIMEMLSRSLSNFWWVLFVVVAVLRLFYAKFFFFHYTSTFVYMLVDIYMHNQELKNMIFTQILQSTKFLAFLNIWIWNALKRVILSKFTHVQFFIVHRKTPFFYIKIIWHGKNGKRTSNVSVWYITLYVDMVVDVFSSSYFLIQMDLPFVRVPFRNV